MPYASNKQAAFMHIHHPEIAAEWHEKGHGYVKGGKNDPGKKKKGRVRKVSVSKAKKDWAIGLSTAAVGGALANQVPPVKIKRKKKGQVKKFLVTSDDPYFNHEAAQKTFDLVMKMDDDTAEMFVLAVMGEIYETTIEKNMVTLQRHLNEVIAKRMADTKTAMLRAVSKGHEEGAVEAAQALAAIEGLIRKDDIPNWAFERKIKRDPTSGRFGVKVKHTQTQPFSNRVADGMGLVPADPEQRRAYAKLNNKQKAQYQDEYRQLSQFLNVVTQSGEADNDVHLRLQDKHGNEFRQPHVGGAHIANSTLLNPNLTLLGVEANPTTLTAGGAAFGLASALGARGGPSPGATPWAGLDRAREGLGDFSTSWTAEGDQKVSNQRLYDRTAAAGKYISDVAPTGSKPYMAAKLAQVVGSHGAEAEQVIGPTARKTAYRYRGTEKTPDKHLVNLYQREIVAAKARGDQPEETEVVMPRAVGRPGAETANRRVTGARERRARPGEAPAPGQMGLSRVINEGRAPTWAERSNGRRVIQDQLRLSLPSGDLYELQSQSGNLPPSEGILLNKDGQIVTQATGYGDDHYLPFNLKNLKALKGGEYIRTRSVGGLTSEDIYTGLYSGARRVTVVSRSGTFSVEFEPDFRGGRRYNDKAARMTRRYEQLLDAVQSNKVSRGPVPAAVSQAIRQQVANDFPGERGPALKAIVQQRINEYREDPEMSAEDEKIMRLVYDQGMKDDPTKDEIEWKRAARNQVMAGKRFNYTLDAAGYEAAQDALAEQFPYYIRSRPVIEEEPSREKDKGYVEPGRLRPTNVRAGLFGTAENQPGGAEVGSQKFSASQENYQRGRIGAGPRDSVARRATPPEAAPPAPRNDPGEPETPAGPGQAIVRPGQPTPNPQAQARAQMEREDASVDLFADILDMADRMPTAVSEYPDLFDMSVPAFSAAVQDPETRASFDQLVDRLNQSGALAGNRSAARYRRARGDVGAVEYDPRMALRWTPDPMAFPNQEGYQPNDTDEQRNTQISAIDDRSRSVTTGLRLSELAQQEGGLRNELEALRGVRRELQLDPGLQEPGNAEGRRRVAQSVFGTLYDPSAIALIVGSSDEDLLNRMTDVHRMRTLKAHYQGSWPQPAQAGTRPATPPNPEVRGLEHGMNMTRVGERLEGLKAYRAHLPNDSLEETEGDEAFYAAQRMYDNFVRGGGHTPTEEDVINMLNATEDAYRNRPRSNA